ncbi:MAG TPA: hypothetical protein VHV10_05180 [Ktedonobacteraceae bacterium]|jgi:hypothetical protein|nr:hypothetical protein [Ktedonobacteraceae bacterium]
MSNNDITARCHAALNRLSKWKSVFTGWQLGTVPLGYAPGDAVRDHRETTLLLRAENSTLLGLCIRKGLFTEDEYHLALAKEAEQLSKDYEKKFPGMKATDIGMQFNAQAVETMKDWLP